jgi:hypothetical protein
MTVALGATVAVAPVFATSLPAALETIGRFRWRLPPLVVAAALTNYTGRDQTGSVSPTCSVASPLVWPQLPRRPSPARPPAVTLSLTRQAGRATSSSRGVGARLFVVERFPA